MSSAALGQLQHFRGDLPTLAHETRHEGTHCATASMATGWSGQSAVWTSVRKRHAPSRPSRRVRFLTDVYISALSPEQLSEVEILRLARHAAACNPEPRRQSRSGELWWRREVVGDSRRSDQRRRVTGTAADSFALERSQNGKEYTTLRRVVKRRRSVNEPAKLMLELDAASCGVDPSGIGFNGNGSAGRSGIRRSRRCSSEPNGRSSRGAGGGSSSPLAGSRSTPRRPVAGCT